MKERQYQGRLSSSLVPLCVSVGFGASRFGSRNRNLLAKRIQVWQGRVHVGHPRARFLERQRGTDRALSKSGTLFAEPRCRTVLLGSDSPACDEVRSVPARLVIAPVLDRAFAVGGIAQGSSEKNLESNDRKTFFLPYRREDDRRIVGPCPVVPPRHAERLDADRIEEKHTRPGDIAACHRKAIEFTCQGCKRQVGEVERCVSCGHRLVRIAKKTFAEISAGKPYAVRARKRQYRILDVRHVQDDIVRLTAWRNDVVVSAQIPIILAEELICQASGAIGQALRTPRTAPIVIHPHDVLCKIFEVSKPSGFVAAKATVVEAEAFENDRLATLRRHVVPVADRPTRDIDRIAQSATCRKGLKCLRSFPRSGRPACQNISSVTGALVRPNLPLVTLRAQFSQDLHRGQESACKGENADNDCDDCDNSASPHPGRQCRACAVEKIDEAPNSASASDSGNASGFADAKQTGERRSEQLDSPRQEVLLPATDTLSGRSERKHLLAPTLRRINQKSLLSMPVAT